MRPPEFFKDAYDRLWRLIAEERISPPARFLPYAFQTHTGNVIYDLRDAEFTRELLNSINQFSARLHRLVLWEAVIADYPEDDAYELRFEFTRLILYFCLHQPYEFRSRLIYSATLLCYDQALAHGLILPRHIAKDRDINFASLRKVAGHWQAGEYLLESVEALNSTELRELTNNYRNRAQHGIPPGIDFGHTNIIDRKVSSAGGVAYSFGEAGPLRTDVIVPQLVGESDRMRAAFHAYRLLVNEHEAQAKAPR